MDAKTFKSSFIPSPPDYRDFAYGLLVPIEDLPEHYSCEDEFKYPVKDQGKWGTCVGQACASLKEIHEVRNYPLQPPELSPLFVYAECKKVDGIPDTEGTYPRVAMAVLKKQGICLENLMPYDSMDKPLPMTTAEALENAENFKIGAYARIQTIPELKQAIYKEGPVLAGILVFENFLNPNSAGFIPLPSGRLLGGHAICVIGWNDTLINGQQQGFFRIRNSWGKFWGDKGYGWIPYDFFNYKVLNIQPVWLESWSSVDIILPPKNADLIEMWIGKKRARIDGVEVKLEQAPVLKRITGRTLVPLRFIAEVLGYKVDWDKKEKKITITK